MLCLLLFLCLSVIGKIWPSPKYNVSAPNGFQVNVSCDLHPPYDKLVTTSGGDLVDGVFGQSNITCPENGPSPWVVWRFQPVNTNRSLTISFKFNQSYFFHSFTFNCLGQSNKPQSIYLFTEVDIRLLADDGTLAGHIQLSLDRSSFKKSLNPTNVTVYTDQPSVKPSQHVIVTFIVGRGKWIVLGEVQFESELGKMLSLGVTKSNIQ